MLLSSLSAPCGQTPRIPPRQSDNAVFNYARRAIPVGDRPISASQDQFRREVDFISVWSFQFRERFSSGKFSQNEGGSRISGNYFYQLRSKRKTKTITNFKLNIIIIFGVHIIDYSHFN